MKTKIKNYKILFCEDNKDLRLTFKLALKNYTDNILLAEDGKEGLEIFKKELPDIVITDIDMPKMNGIELIKKIKKIKPDIPTIITTAYDDTKYLLESIEVGVDKFLIKPIKKSELLSTILKIVEELENKKIVEEYKKKLEEEKIQKHTKSIISQLVDSIICPILIIQDNRVKFVNNEFKKIFGEEALEEIKNDISNIDKFFDKKGDFCKSIKEFSLQEPYKNRVSISVTGIRRIYQVVVVEITFEEEDKTSTIYIFQDITMVEYQKLKAKQYAEMLEDYLINTKYKNKTQETLQKDIDEFKKITIEEETRELNKEDTAILRKSHKDNKISAEEFLSSLTYSIKEEVDELKDLEEDLDYHLNNFFTNPDKHSLMKIISILDQYANTIKHLDEFDDLANALFSIRDLLSSHLDDIDKEKSESIKIFLMGIFEDLKKWRETIFETMDTEDIHYLDASLFSSCLQLELTLTGVKPADEDDDIEFF